MRISRFTVENEIHYGVVQGEGEDQVVVPIAGDPFYNGIQPIEGASWKAQDVRLLAGSVVTGLVAPLDSSLHGAYLAIVVGSMAVTAAVLVLLTTSAARDRLEKIATAPHMP